MVFFFFNAPEAFVTSEILLRKNNNEPFDDTYNDIQNAFWILILDKDLALESTCGTNKKTLNIFLPKGKLLFYITNKHCSEIQFKKINYTRKTNVGGSNLENWLQNITSETKTPMQSSKDLKREGTNFKKNTHTNTRKWNMQSKESIPSYIVSPNPQTNTHTPGNKAGAETEQKPKVTRTEIELHRVANTHTLWEHIFI